MQKRKFVSSSFRQTECRVASQTHCNIGATELGKSTQCARVTAPLCAVPYSTGRNVSVLQRQLRPAVFWNANDFSIREPVARPRHFPGCPAWTVFGCRVCKSQHVPVQVDAIGLQTANGASTFISTCGRHDRLASETSVSSCSNAADAQEIPQVLAEWICPDAQVDRVGIGRGRQQRPGRKRFLGSPLAAVISAVFRLMRVGKARLGRRQLAQWHVVLVVEIAFAVADPHPSGIFGERALGLVFLDLRDQRDNLAR